MKYIPRPYQGRMTRAAMLHNVLLAARPGLGKTAAILDAVDQMVFDRLEVRQVLIVGPKVVVESTWPNEIAKWSNFSRLTHRVWDAAEFGYEVQEELVEEIVISRKLRPGDAEALQAKVLADRSVIHLVSRDHFYNLVLALGKAWPYDVLVLDESYAFSDCEASRYRAVTAILPFTERVILANGTPVGNSLDKLWAQMCLVDGGDALGKDITMFRMKWMTPDKMDRSRGRVFSWKAEEGALPQIIERCRSKLVAMREEDWLTLPPLVTRPVPVDIPMVEYRRMARDLLLKMGDSVALAANAGVLYNKLAQIACGIVFDSEREVHEIHRVKLDALAELAEERAGPVLVWTSFQPDIARIRKLFPKAHLASKTKDLERRWNAGELDVLIAHPETLAYGANLQDCPGSSMIWFGVTGNAVWWNQGIKRLHRSGRKEPVLNSVIVARGTVEDLMLESRVGREAVEEDLMLALAYTQEESFQ
jgi:SNF2 family DNA or RNA helicase